jgi:hypothetical protein
MTPAQPALDAMMEGVTRYDPTGVCVRSEHGAYVRFTDYDALAAKVRAQRETIAGLTAERDSFLAVLQGARYPNIDSIAQNSVEQSHALGEAVMCLTIERGNRIAALEAEVASLRAAPVAMREMAARHVTLLGFQVKRNPVVSLPDFFNAVLEPIEKCADAIRALPLDAPAPVDPVQVFRDRDGNVVGRSWKPSTPDPVAEAARVLLGAWRNSETTEADDLAQDELDMREAPDANMVIEAWLRALAQESSHE